jgi:hypothetical protein
MKNLIYSVIVATASFALGWYVGGTAWAGIPTSLLGFIICFFVLARKSLNKMQVIMQEGMSEIETAQGSQDPDYQSKQLDKAIAIMTKGIEDTKEQFMLDMVFHAQIGALQYQKASLYTQLKMQKQMMRQTSEVQKADKKIKNSFELARQSLTVSLKNNWVTTITRNWMAVGMLACLEFRDKKIDAAISRLKSANGPGSGEALYFGLLSWMQYQNKQEGESLLTLTSGIEKHPESQHLKDMMTAIQNKEEPDPFVFGMNWMMFFPEQLTPEKAYAFQTQMQAEKEANGLDGIDTSSLNRKQKRALEKQRKKGFSAGKKPPISGSALERQKLLRKKFRK